MIKHRRSLQAVLGVLAIGLFLCAVPFAHAQTDLETALKPLSGPNGAGYMQPAADLFGANMNSGYFHSAAISRVGFFIEFDLIGMGSLVSDDAKSYTAQTPTGFTPSSAKTATIFGQTGTTVQNTNPAGLAYRFPDGIFNTGFFPYVTTQLTIGNLIGTQAVIRYAPIPKVPDLIPKSTSYALGLRHSISQWFPGLPLDLAVSGYMSSYKAEELLDYSGFLLGAQASKDFGIVTVFGGLAYETSTLKMEWTSSDPSAPGKVKQDLTGANTVRVTAGATLNLGIFRLFADMNFGSVTAFSAGFGFGG